MKTLISLRQTRRISRSPQCLKHRDARIVQNNTAHLQITKVYSQQQPILHNVTRTYKLAAQINIAPRRLSMPTAPAVIPKVLDMTRHHSCGWKNPNPHINMRSVLNSEISQKRAFVVTPPQKHHHQSLNSSSSFAKRRMHFQKEKQRNLADTNLRVGWKDMQRSLHSSPERVELTELPYIGVWMGQAARTYLEFLATLETLTVTGQRDDIIYLQNGTADLPSSSSQSFTLRPDAASTFATEEKQTVPILQPEVLQNVILRYNTWLHLHKNFPADAAHIHAPPDVQFMLNVHMTQPISYVSMCHLHFRIIQDFEWGSHSLTAQPSLKATEMWTDFVKQNAMTELSDLIGMDLGPPAAKQAQHLQLLRKNIFSNKSLDRDQLIRDSFREYQQFWFLKKRYPYHTLIPSLPVDLIWHSHMRYPTIYFQDSYRYFHTLLNHSSAIRAPDLVSAQYDTEKLWQRYFPEALYRSNELVVEDRKNRSVLAVLGLGMCGCFSVGFFASSLGIVPLSMLFAFVSVATVLAMQNEMNPTAKLKLQNIRIQPWFEEQQRAYTETFQKKDKEK